MLLQQWVSGIVDGEIKTNLNNRDVYGENSYSYSQIAEREVGFVGADLGLDIFLMNLSPYTNFDDATSNGRSEWVDLTELMMGFGWVLGIGYNRLRYR